MKQKEEKQNKRKGAWAERESIEGEGGEREGGREERSKKKLKMKITQTIKALNWR